MARSNKQDQCYACRGTLKDSFQAFALQLNRIDYTLPGQTPSEQAFLQTSDSIVLVRFCSSACCKSKLGGLLELQGIPAGLQHNRVGGGPICPCGKCGKPVSLTQPHGAWLRAKYFFQADGEAEEFPDWFDVLTVMCMDCLCPDTTDEAITSRPDNESVKAPDRVELEGSSLKV